VSFLYSRTGASISFFICVAEQVRVVSIVEAESHLIEVGRLMLRRAFMPRSNDASPVSTFPLPSPRHPRILNSSGNLGARLPRLALKTAKKIAIEG